MSYTKLLWALVALPLAHVVRGAYSAFEDCPRCPPPRTFRPYDVETISTTTMTEDSGVISTTIDDQTGMDPAISTTTETFVFTAYPVGPTVAIFGTTEILETTSNPVPTTVSVTTEVLTTVTNTTPVSTTAIDTTEIFATVEITDSLTTNVETGTVSTTLVENTPVSTTTIETAKVPTTLVTIEPLTIPPRTSTQVPGAKSTPFSMVLQPVEACPAPTIPAGQPVTTLSPESDLTWGCTPGFVCDPPKPGNCNLWEDAPLDDYVCEPQFCLAAPELPVVDWTEGTAAFYPLTEGYFYLDPNSFGLSYDIFEQVASVELQDGRLTTVITGDNPPMAVDGPRLAKKAKRGVMAGASQAKMRDGVYPGICYRICNEPYLEAQQLGKVKDELCKEGSAFLEGVDGCNECIAVNTDTDLLGTDTNLVPNFAQFLDFCNAVGPVSSVENRPLAAQGAPGPSVQTADSAASVDSKVYPVPPIPPHLTDSSSPISTAGRLATTSSGTGSARNTISLLPGSLTTPTNVPTTSVSGSFIDPSARSFPPVYSTTSTPPVVTAGANTRPDTPALGALIFAFIVTLWVT